MHNKIEDKMQNFTSQLKNEKKEEISALKNIIAK